MKTLTITGVFLLLVFSLTFVFSGDINTSPMLGEEDARFSVIEYSDFQCPFCARASTSTVADLINSSYFRNGEINFIYKHFPLSSIHPQAQKAAEASVCAHEQDKFWEYHDLLFENQANLAINNLKAYASNLRLNTGKFNACLDSGMASNKVSLDKKEGEAYGARGTPYFVLVDNNNGNKHSVSGAVPFANIEKGIIALKAGDASNIPTVDPESPTNEDPTERKPICNGCEFEDKCYPYGHRKSGKFCFDESNNFSNQSVGGSSCENNFECTTNVCVSGQCIKEGFIDKILNFFKRLFG